MPLLRFAVLTTLAASLLGGHAWAEEPPQTQSAARKLLLEKDLDLPSQHLKTHVLKVVFPPAFKTPLHTHEGPGPRYVVRGRVKIEESGVSHVYGPGDVFWESGQWMTVENVGDGEAEVLLIELVSK